MEKLKQKAILNGLVVIGTFAGAAALVVLDIFDGSAFIIAALACYPMARYLWLYAGYVRRNPVRIVQKSLPKIGFSLEKSEWDESHTAIRFHGKYRGDNFLVEAANDNAYVMIFDMPWHGVKSSDPMVPKILEAINEVNSATSNMSVIMCEPDDEGVRQIYTLCRTILPTFRPEQYLDSLMCDMLNRKRALAEAINKERPYMAQRRTPVGFNVQDALASSDGRISPAAKTKSDVED